MVKYWIILQVKGNTLLEETAFNGKTDSDRRR